jgi:hypothetical protein
MDFYPRFTETFVHPALPMRRAYQLCRRRFTYAKGIDAGFCQNISIRGLETDKLK